MSETQQRKECERIAAELYTDVKRGDVVASKQYTLKEFCEMWMQDYPPTAGLSPVTVEGYRALLEGRIYPALGQVKLAQLTPQQITRFYRAMLTEEGRGYRGKGRKLSASTVLHYHRLLRSVLNTAVDWGVLANNPVLKATVPKNDTKEMKAYTPEQTTALLLALEDAPLHYQVGTILAVLCQLRKGEIAGLDWSDITLPQYALPFLRRLKAEQNITRLQLGEDWVNSGAIFIQWNGAHMHPDTLSKWFHDFLVQKGLPLIRLHDLRHTGISLMFFNGEDAPTAAERAGHSKASVTLSVYAHAYKQKDRDATARLEALVVPKQAKKTGEKTE